MAISEDDWDTAWAFYSRSPDALAGRLRGEIPGRAAELCGTKAFRAIVEMLGGDELSIPGRKWLQREGMDPGLPVDAPHKIRPVLRSLAAQSGADPASVESVVEAAKVRLQRIARRDNAARPDLATWARRVRAATTAEPHHSLLQMLDACGDPAAVRRVAMHLQGLTLHVPTREQAIRAYRDYAIWTTLNMPGGLAEAAAVAAQWGISESRARSIARRKTPSA